MIQLLQAHEERLPEDVIITGPLHDLIEAWVLQRPVLRPGVPGTRPRFEYRSLAI